MWWKRNKRKVVLPVTAAVILAAAFWYGGGSPGLQGQPGQPAEPVSAPQLDGEPVSPPGTGPETQPSALPPEQAPGTGTEPSAPGPAAPETGTEPPPGSAPEAPSAAAEPPAAPPANGGEGAGGSTPPETGPSDPPSGGEDAPGMVIDPDTGKDLYFTSPPPEGKPLPVEPQDVEISDTACTCTISISCASILDHMDWLDGEKAELVPEDGWVLHPTEVTFYEGESVFNLLQRTCKQNKIHMEFANTPMYNSALIEGIHNIYEFDCGELSGWMYKVNDWFPNYGCSRYKLKDGDTVCWEYTCSLGEDIGGYNAIGG